MMNEEKKEKKPTKKKVSKSELEKSEVKEQTFLTLGLTQEQVETLIANGKTNKVPNKTTKTKREIIVSNVFTVFNFLNFAVAGWLISVGSYKNTIFISLIIMNIIIGIVQELRSKKAIDSLSLLNAPSAVVIRAGEEVEIPSDAIVLGDLIKLNSGKEISADSIVLQGVIEVNEALLTGESNAIVKKPGDALFAGSFVVSGEAFAKAQKVGLDSYIQKLSAQAKKYKRPNSEILNDLTRLIKVVTIIIVIMGGILFIRQLQGGNSYQQAVIGTSGGIIGMIPSGLFFLTSVSLAVGVIKLARHKTLVQDLFCIEMLARVNVLCLDKTGTITDGTMVVKEVEELAAEKYNVKAIIALIQGTFRDENPTDLALIAKFGQNKRGSVTGSIPFSSARKFSAITSKRHQMSFLIGAPEFIMKKNYKQLATQVEEYALKDYRVLLLAASPTQIVGADTQFEEIEPIAFILIEDRIREEAIDTIRFFKENDVIVRVISGDNALTVSSIAKRVGIDNADKYISLDGMNDNQIRKIANEYTVFGRVTPSQKQLLIKVFKENGDTVAMTGDGVNDILALKESDCSIAMANGSDAARNISHLVLMDSNFATLPLVVKEGRRVINNIQKVATLFLTKTVFTFLLVLLVIIRGGDIYPIQTIQLTYYDFPIITIPAYYFAAFENNMNRIKGNFLFNVLFNAIPGALLVGLNYIVILLFSQRLGMGAAAISTTTVLTTAVVGFFVLFAVSKPFNRWRKIIFSLSILIFLVMIVFLHDILEISELRNLSIANLLLILVISQYSYIVLSLFYRGSMQVKDWIISFRQWRYKRKMEKAHQRKMRQRKKARALRQKLEKKKQAQLEKETIEEESDL